MREMNRTQTLGLILVGLSLVTYLGGGLFASSWLAATDPNGVHIYVRDAETGQHLEKELVTVTVTGFSYFGVDHPMTVELRPSKTTPTYWSFSSSLYTSYHVSVTATGYVTQTGSVSMPQNFIKEYTYRLSPEPEPGEPDPEPVPPEEPEPVELEADVYVNDSPVSPGDTLQLTTLTLSFRVVVTRGSFQQIWGHVDETRVAFDVNGSEATAVYTLPGDGIYDVDVRVLDVGGEERPLASFAAVYGSAEDPGDTVQEAVEEALGRDATLLSGALALMGVGVYLWGSLEEDER